MPENLGSLFKQPQLPSTNNSGTLPQLEANYNSSTIFNTLQFSQLTKKTNPNEGGYSKKVKFKFEYKTHLYSFSIEYHKTAIPSSLITRTYLETK